MRGDLRWLLWRLRAGMVRPSALQEAVEEACNRLLNERFDPGETHHQEISPFAWPFLARFEKEISQARFLAWEGHHVEAVRAVEGAEAALEGARRMAQVHRAWETALGIWTDFWERFDLASYPDLATVRECTRLLAVARSFLEAGEPRKARFVVRQCRHTFKRLATPASDLERRKHLVRRLVDLQRTPFRPPEALVGLLSRITDEGLLDFAERLLEDWEMKAEASGEAGSGIEPSPPGNLKRIVNIGREADLLVQELSRVAPPDANGEIEKLTESSDEGA